MTMLTLSRPVDWLDSLASCGFRSNNDGVFAGNGVALTMRGGWCRLERMATAEAAAQLGKAGLWRLAGDGMVFELPMTAFEEADPFDVPMHQLAASPLQDCLKWALHTVGGAPPSGWSAPERGLVESWIPPGFLTVRSGATVRRGELLHSARRLALRFPIVPAVSADLPQPRRIRLEDLVRDAQNGCRLARLAVAPNLDGSAAVVAEVDLTGVPHVVCEPIFLAGLDSLRFVVSWLAEIMDVLADATVTSELLAVPPCNQSVLTTQ